VRTINLEEGMPRVHEALARLQEDLESLPVSTQAVKLIHGYGSMGVGGAIRDAVRKELVGMMKAGQIRYFILGEEWRKPDGATAYWLRVFPALHSDGDLGRGNPGVTIVILRNPSRCGSALPKLSCAPSCLREELEDQKNSGQVVLKVIKPRTAESIKAFTHVMRELKREGSIKHFIRGENWATSDPGTMQWVRKFPQCDGDCHLGSGSQEVFIVFLTRKLKGKPSTFSARDKVDLTPYGRSDQAQLGV
jgi:hypothetical protein